MRIFLIAAFLSETTAIPGGNNLKNHWDFTKYFFKDGHLIIPDQITESPEFDLGGVLPSSGITFKDPYTSPYGGWWSGENVG